MHIGVVGAGPAGLTAAHRLQQAGHTVEVLESSAVAGGRTHARHFGPSHHCDTGAGWLASFYTRTLALFDELGCRDLLLPRTVRGADDITVGGATDKLPFPPNVAAASPLVTAEEKRILATYRTRLVAELSARLAVDLQYDDHDAEAEVAPLGAGVVEDIMRPTSEGRSSHPCNTCPRQCCAPGWMGPSTRPVMAWTRRGCG